MFVRPSTVLFSVAALAGVATAVPTLQARDACNSGSVQCCNSVQESSSFINEIFGWLGIPIPTTGTHVGFTCSPITIGGFGSGSSCTQQTVCCENNTFNGISTGCSPIIINL